MPCYHPLSGYYSKKVNETGKRSLVFNVEQALLPEPVFIPCGRCIGCRLDKSLSWALRCVNEAQLYDENCFVTLTFNEENNPGSLKVTDFQRFMKRLRKCISPRKVRFFHCGEYGAKFLRPHHHACLFGYDFPDKVLFKNSLSNPLYTSEILSQLWPYGYSTIGNVTFESASYVARYVLKKWSKEELSGDELYENMKGISNQKSKKEFYGDFKEEYITMSRKPGIGSEWFNKFKSDIYPGGFAIVNGKKVKPPRFYDDMFLLDNEFLMSKIKGERTEKALSNPHNSPTRLAVREYIKKQTAQKCLKRSYEDATSSFLNI